jgi:hypothetical protein
MRGGFLEVPNSIKYFLLPGEPEYLEAPLIEIGITIR